MTDQIQLLKNKINALEFQNNKLFEQLKEVRQEKDHYKHLINISRDVIWTMDLDLNFTFLSPSTEKLYGYTKEERKNISIDKLFTEQSITKAKWILHQKLNASFAEQKEAHVIEMEGIHKNGKKIWVEVVMQFLFNKKNEPIAIQGNTRDITRRKKTEDFLKETKYELEQTLMYIVDGMFTVNTEGKIIYVNTKAAEMFGWKHPKIECSYNDIKLIDHNYNEIPGKNMPVSEAINNKIITRQAFYGVRHDSGRVSWIILSCGPLKDTDGKVYGAVVNYSDLTKQINTQKALETERFYWEKSFENANEGMIIINEESQIIQCNNTFSKLVGKSRDDIIGETSQKIIHNSHCHVEYCALDLAIKKNEKYTTEYWEPFLSRYLKVSANPFIDQNSNMQFVFITFFDVTHEKKVEEELIESERKFRFMFNRMISGFALHKMIYDKDGNPVDYLFIDVNPAFERLTGLKREKIINKTVKEALPKTEDYWIQNFGKVASSANPARFEDYSVEFDKYFEVIAYAPKIGYFVSIFNDITERKKAEIAVARSEDKFRNLFNNVNDAIFIHDEKGKILEVNNIACMRLKYSRDKLLNMNLADLCLPQFKKFLLQKFKQLGKEKKVLYETMHKTKQGHYIPTEVNSRMIEYEGFPAIFSVARNITKRRKMEKRIIENEYKYRMLYSNAPLAYQALDGQGKIIDVNDKWLEMMQFKRENVLNRLFKGFLTRKSKNDYDEIFKTFKNKGNITDFKCNLVRRDGSILSASFEGKGVIDKHEKSFRSYLVFRDITTEEKTKRALVDSEARYRMLVNLSPNLIMTIKDHLIAFVNPATYKVLKYKTGSLRNMDFFKLIDNTEVDKVDTILNKLHHDESIENVRLLMKSKNNDTVFTETSFIAVDVKEEGGKTVVMIAKDITAQVQSEQNVLSAVIETQEKERKSFAENLHDELGPFLSGIKLYVEEIAREDLSKSNRNELVSYLKRMSDDAIKNTRNISNMLMPNVLTNYGVYKAVERFCGNLQASKKINFNLDFNEPGKKYSDKLEVALYRIIIELINNTIKHAKAENIKIKLHDNGKILHFIYRDDGKGFDFEKKLNSGNGLGLQNIDSRVKLLGGKARYWSAPGKGIIIGVEFDLEQFSTNA